ncbi:MAG TPA: HepT-like ribonuclease domain-containing protein [Candidatus Kapabacteria bacterium]|nr:HepT-like ribonuclease domain-containing protein [Candidatus Kapabacteria bacterium]
MRTDIERLQDIIEAGEQILNYMERLQASAHTGEEDVFHDAILHQLMVIGEASVNVNSDLKKKYPAIPWAIIKAFRNILVHEYSGIRWDRVWNAIDRLPELMVSIKEILRNEYGTK